MDVVFWSNIGFLYVFEFPLAPLVSSVHDFLVSSNSIGFLHIFVFLLDTPLSSQHHRFPLTLSVLTWYSLVISIFFNFSGFLWLYRFSLAISDLTWYSLAISIFSNFSGFLWLYRFPLAISVLTWYSLAISIFFNYSGFRCPLLATPYSLWQHRFH